ncbi:dienelactone hydrolase family protein [Saccharospirillum salsuginis]|uniref:Hydrolase n=1 Tax=Saccharospirillum salsuginis TaxID=418750 RepID=A0A918NIY4_9GAMM|nr:dienelactone hydrolase family protein [Saccharospirillum salsuginis]GGX73624.1 hydrolase [Saccharospirillum salsuginis]
MTEDLKTHTEAVTIPIGPNSLNADITMPPRVLRGIVLFAHGSGSSRLSPRNRTVARGLVGRGMATVLLDLLTEQEDQVDQITREYRFDIPLLARRLVAATDWVLEQPRFRTAPIGYFGASTGAAAALIAAAEKAERVSAVVSRGGRPDLAGEALPRVQAPTRLIVGGNDTAVIEMNRDAAGEMRCPVQVDIVPGASHLFEEPGVLERVMELAGEWFEQHLDSG